MIHLVIGNNGERVEFPETEARWLAARSTIVECKVAHFVDYTHHKFYDLTEYTIYHPGTRNGKMVTMMDVRERLSEMKNA